MDEINLLGESWTSEQDHDDYRWRRMRVAGERLGASLYELPPGGRTFPYHPDSGKIMVRWSPAEGDSLWFREEDASDYWRGES